jgi:hypothetical protein
MNVAVIHHIIFSKNRATCFGSKMIDLIGLNYEGIYYNRISGFRSENLEVKIYVQCKKIWKA